MHSPTPSRRLLTLLGLVLMLLFAGPAAAKNANPGVIPPNADAYGKSYAEWAVAWWQWAFSLPGAHHPIFDKTGADCGRKQLEKAWFLAGYFDAEGQSSHAVVSRSCTIPNGRAIFFPVLNGWNDFVGEDLPPNPRQVLIDRCLGFVENPRQLDVTLDGRPLKNVAGYAIEPTFFTYTMPDHGFFDVAFGLNFSGSPPEPGAVTCGTYILLSPLSSGHHDLRIQTINEDGTVSQDVTYSLTIKK